eukprot:10269471-Alexandrium_andersonii.AAC.1
MLDEVALDVVREPSAPALQRAGAEELASILGGKARLGDAAALQARIAAVELRRNGRTHVRREERAPEAQAQQLLQGHCRD